jgi:hypothetical protein
MQIKSLYISFSRQDLGLLFRSGILRTNQKRLQSVIYDIDQIISTMIKDRIKFQPVYASIEANGYAEATVQKTYRPNASGAISAISRYGIVCVLKSRLLNRLIRRITTRIYSIRCSLSIDWCRENR